MTAKWRTRLSHRRAAGRSATFVERSVTTPSGHTFLDELLYRWKRHDSVASRSGAANAGYVGMQRSDG